MAALEDVDRDGSHCCAGGHYLLAATAGKKTILLATLNHCYLRTADAVKQSKAPGYWVDSVITLFSEFTATYPA